MGIINSAAANQDKQSGQGAADKLNNGLSPNGKATDSDSVKVRILVAQLKKAGNFENESRITSFFICCVFYLGSII